jgi:signal transduction histidine kinase
MSLFFRPRLSIAVSTVAATVASLIAIEALGRLSTAAIAAARGVTVWQDLVWAMLAAMAGAGVAAYCVRQRLDRRLARLGDSLRRIERGDLSAPIEDLERKDAVGSLARVVETLRDRTAARNRADGAAAALDASAVEQRRDAETELAQTGRALAVGEFAALVAHEIRQPISAILLNCAAADNYLSRADVGLGEARAAIQRVRRDAERAGTVIQGIRALLSDAQPTYGTVDLNQVLEETLSLVGDDLRRADVTLVTRFSPAVAAVWGDRGQVQQVVINLVSNAVEAMRTTTPLKRVLEVSTDMRGGTAPMVSVRDTGIGLDPKAIDRLFDPLFTTRPSGMGLGLSISRSIVEAHGGRLWATASTPTGACFSFTLQSAAAGAAGRPEAGPTPVAEVIAMTPRGRARRQARAA